MPAEGATDRSDSWRTEFLIAGARAVLAAFALLALHLDDAGAAPSLALARDLLAAYLVYSILILLAAWLRPVVGGRLRHLSHGLDLAMFCVLLFVTDPTTSPLFAFFVFALVVAAMRWQWRGALLTAAFLLVTFLALGAYSGAIAADPDFELDRFVLRSAYLAVVAVLVGYLSDHESRLRRRTAEMAVIEERIKLARDLHDGVIQGLTGAALKLQAAKAGTSGRTHKILDEVLDLLVDEQRELRRFMADRGEGGDRDPGDGFARLRELPAKFERQWGLAVAMDLRLDDRPRIAAAAMDVYWLVREALVNGVRHGAAQAARVELVSDGDGIAVTVSDDGGGMPLKGEYDLAELNRQGIGPRSIRQRVAECGGDLRLSSSASGTRIDIRLPLTRGKF